MKSNDIVWGKKAVLNLVVVLITAFLVIFSCKNKNSKTEPNPVSHSSQSLAFHSFTQQDFETLHSPELDSSTYTIIKNFYHYFWNLNDLSGGLLVAKGNTLLYENYRGFANLKDSIPITKNTPIHIASISKNITAMMVLKLVEKKKITLQQKVKSILIDFPYPNITIFDLLTHRSGLGNYDFYAEDLGYATDSVQFTNKRMYKMFAECKPSLIFRPNTQHSYCNTNYAFLALIIAEVTKMPFPDAMKKLVFEPIGMKNTFVFQEKDFKTASLSYYRNKKQWKWDFRDLIYGDKNVYTTPQDLFKYSKAMFTDKFIRKSLLDSAMVGYSNERKGAKNYGFGFRIREIAEGKFVTFHNGSWHGNNTVFVHLPKEQITIIALGNKSSRANYSAFSLISVLGDYPLEIEDQEEFMETTDSIEIDTLNEDFIHEMKIHIEEKKHLNVEEKSKKSKPNKPQIADTTSVVIPLKKDSVITPKNLDKRKPTEENK